MFDIICICSRKESKNLFKQKKAQNTEVFWVEKMKQFDMQNVDTIDVDQRKVLLRTIASAAASLPPPDKKVLRTEPSGFNHIVLPLNT